MYLCHKWALFHKMAEKITSRWKPNGFKAQIRAPVAEIDSPFPLPGGYNAYRLGIRIAIIPTDYKTLEDLCLRLMRR
jgi:hypothetical protein